MTPEDYVQLLNKLREMFPGVSAGGIISMAQEIVEQENNEDNG